MNRFGTIYSRPDEKDRLAEQPCQVGKACEDQWPATGKREALATMKRDESRHSDTLGTLDLKPLRLFSKILCPIDFGENSLRALDLAARMAVHHGAALDVLHVFEPHADNLHPTQEGGALEPAIARLREIAAKRLSRVRHQCVIAVGESSDKIVQMARKIGSDLVVIGAPARPVFSRLLLGSVTDRVLERSHCPVLVSLPDNESVLETTSEACRIE